VKKSEEDSNGSYSTSFATHCCTVGIPATNFRCQLMSPILVRATSYDGLAPAFAETVSGHRGVMRHIDMGQFRKTASI
jgi:hypothetical protein